VQAVAAAAAGAVYVSEQFAEGVVDVVVSRRLAGTRQRAALRTLTTRERGVLRHVVDGRSNAQVARALNISVGTVRFHVSNILTKLGRKSRAALIALIMQGPSSY
jgi:DNA-binding NarL/FixJ family response regulator